MFSATSFQEERKSLLDYPDEFVEEFVDDGCCSDCDEIECSCWEFSQVLFTVMLVYCVMRLLSS